MAGNGTAPRFKQKNQATESMKSTRCSMKDSNPPPSSGIARPKGRGYLILLALLTLLWFAAMALGPRLVAGSRGNAQPNCMVAISAAVENSQVDFHYFR